MKVDDPRSVSSQSVTPTSEQTQAADRKVKPQVSSNDAVRLSSDLQLVDVAVRAAALAGDVRPEAVARARALLDSGQLSKEDACDFRGRHILVNALGGFNEEVEVDVDQIALSSGDRILMCSDGLTDMVDDDTICRVLVERKESGEACQRLIDLALERGGKDNVTVVVATYTF